MAFFPSWKAFWQEPSQVVIREAGERTYGDPVPAGPSADRHAPYALLSQSAYRKTEAHRIRRQKSWLRKFRTRVVSPVDSDATLAKMGWTQIKSFPRQRLQNPTLAGLHVEAWEHVASGEIAIAFGGTFFWSWNSWLANLRWFIPHDRDEYTQLVSVIAPEFVSLLETMPSIKIVSSTGHSLGGGLAQQLAYALPVAEVPRVSAVYAFDPSPVTGFFSVPKALRDINIARLKTSRIFERDEVLAVIRSLLNLFAKPSKIAPEIVTIRYSVIPSWNPISDHSIGSLAAGILRLSSANQHTQKAANQLDT